MRLGHWLVIIAVVAVLYWVYEANPGNIFMRGQ
jgi:hypothetical protein